MPVSKRTNFLNYHKLAKKIEKRSQKKRVLYEEYGKEKINRVRHKKDFSWRKRAQNPFEKEDQWFKTKQRIKFLMLCVILCSIFGIALYHPFFKIKNIQITGNSRITKEEIIEDTTSILNYKRFLLFPGQNYFVANIQEINEILKEKLPINSIIIEKKFPNKLAITIEEKTAAIIYDNGVEYVKIGPDGTLIEKVRKVSSDEWKEITTSSTKINEQGEEIITQIVIDRSHTPSVKSIQAEVGELPIFFDKTTSSTIDLQQIILSSDITQKVLFIYEQLTAHTDIPITYITLEDTQGHGNIYTTDGWHVKLNFTQDVEKQIQTLEYLIQSKKISTTQKLLYIDLQYLPQVYWQ